MTTLSQLEVNNLKDNVLEYLRKNSNQATLFELIANCIIPDAVAVSVFKEYLREMEQNKVIKATEVSESRLLLRLTGKGKKFLIKGGYSNYEKEVSKKERQEVSKKEQQEVSKKEQQKEEYPQDNRERVNPKTENLKLTKWLSIIAIIISVVSIFISIFKK
jgi:hypothetical protein